MKVRIVCSGTRPDFDFKIHQAFIYDQVEAIKELNNDIQFRYFFIRQKGISGYLNEFRRLRKSIQEDPCDLIHAHFGLAAFLAALQRKEPVIATFHGSDINNAKTRLISALVNILARASIFVSEGLRKKSCAALRSFVIPCGVDLSLFFPRDRTVCRQELGLDPEKKYVLFASHFDNPVKNYKLLEEALKQWDGVKPIVLELKNRARAEVPVLMNAADVCVLTSFSEGSPQFIKEALACNRPVVATNVGDISELLSGVENCRITTFEPENVKQSLKLLINKNQSNGREFLSRFDHHHTAEAVIQVYKSALNRFENV
jgi:teichuronic acid biosynthesis glycosyltransferase TuaC